jgi:hypothetical protein
MKKGIEFRPECICLIFGKLFLRLTAGSKAIYSDKSIEFFRKGK